MTLLDLLIITIKLMLALFSVSNTSWKCCNGEDPSQDTLNKVTSWIKSTSTWQLGRVWNRTNDIDIKLQLDNCTTSPSCRNVEHVVLHIYILNVIYLQLNSRVSYHQHYSLPCSWWRRWRPQARPPLWPAWRALSLPFWKWPVDACPPSTAISCYTSIM